MAVLTTPLLNKGTAFAVEERIALGPTGLLPAAISTLDAQVKCAYVQYEGLGDALNKNLYLTALHDRNEILFYRLFSERLREMIPMVSDLTVGVAMEQSRHECRRPRGVYLSIDHTEANRRGGRCGGCRGGRPGPCRAGRYRPAMCKTRCGSRSTAGSRQPDMRKGRVE